MILRVTLDSVPDLATLLSTLSEPVLIANFLDLFPFPGILPDLASLEGLRRIDTGDDEIVGYVSPDGTVTAMCFSNAIDRVAEVGGYINGWEYAAGGTHSINTEGIDSVLALQSFLPSCLGTGGMALDLVMRWIFISKGPSMGSGWHVDPIGSAAWMLQVTGSKLWDFRLSDQEISVVLSPGELILVPPGWEHRVHNIGQELNVAVSHNWVPISNQGRMWTDVEQALTYLESPTNILVLLESLQENGLIDNLLMGLLMVLFQSDSGLIDTLVPEKLQKPIHQIRNQLNEEIT
jgi:hypothetical protein